MKSIKIRSLFLSFLKLGLTAFGGPAMVAYVVLVGALISAIIFK
jgi:chromate transport protein ChrA